MGADSDVWSTEDRGHCTWWLTLTQAQAAAALGRELPVLHMSPVRTDHGTT